MIDVDDWLHGTTTTLFSAFAVLAGIPKLLALDFMLTTMNSLGYGTAFTVFIGACWTLAGIGVWLRSWRELAVIGTWFITSGAIAAHLTNGDAFPYHLLAPVVLSAVILWYEGFWHHITPFLDEPRQIQTNE